MKGDTIITELIQRIPYLGICENDIRKCCEELIRCYREKGKVLLCGNGGSCADSDHIVGELMKSFMIKRPINPELDRKLKSVWEEKGDYLSGKLEAALPAISLCTHNALISAISNDIGPDLVFAQQIAGYGRKGDVLIAISTSGISRNIVNACITSKAMSLTTIGITGESGGEMKEYCDISICVPSGSTPEIQEYHLPVFHTICRTVEYWFFHD